jgi:hypothetical protein
MRVESVIGLGGDGLIGGALLAWFYNLIANLNAP